MENWRCLNGDLSCNELKENIGRGIELLNRQGVRVPFAWDNYPIGKAILSMTVLRFKF